MRLIDADFAAEQIRKSDLTNQEKVALVLCLSELPTVAPLPNDPLTLEELREMAKRCEGIYVANMDGSPVFRGQRYCAAVLDFSLAFGSNAMHIHAICGDRMTMWEDDYGKTWGAYRRKPEEGTLANANERMD